MHTHAVGAAVPSRYAISTASRLASASADCRSAGPSCTDPGDKSSQHRRYARLAHNSCCCCPTLPYVQPLSNSQSAPSVQRRWWTGNGEHRSLSVFYGSKYVSPMAACVNVKFGSTHSGHCRPANYFLLYLLINIALSGDLNLRNWSYIRTEFSHCRERTHANTFNIPCDFPFFSNDDHSRIISLL